MNRKHRRKQAKQKAPDDKTRNKVKDASKSYIQHLSEELATTQKWQELGMRLGFTRSQIVQIETSYGEDQSFCAQVMLKDWHSIAKDFMEQPEAYIRDVWKQLTEDLHTACPKPNLARPNESVFNNAKMTSAIRAILFGPTQRTPDRPVPHAALHITNCSNVMIGTTNTIVGSSDRNSDTERKVSSTSKDPEEMIVRSLEIIIERHPEKFSGLNLQKLESEFKKMLVEQKAKEQTFHELSGKKLITFLKEHDYRFNLNLVGGQYFVKSITKPVMPKVIPVKAAQASTSENMPTPNVFVDSDSDNDSIVGAGGKLVKPETSATETAGSKMKSYAAAVGTTDNKQHPAAVCRQPPKCSTTMTASSYHDNVKDVHSDPRDLIEFVKNFSGGHYVLLVCFKEKMKYLDCLALVPWLAVFDFDVESRSNGLLTVLEERIKKRRALYTCTWKDSAKFSDYGTEWCLIRGSVQEADSLTSGKVESGSEK